MPRTATPWQSDCIRNQSSVGQLRTEPAVVNQLDPFLPRCPITSRYNVIPASYNGKLYADSSHQILVGQTAARIRSLLTGRDLRKRKSLNEGAKQSLRRRIPVVSGCYSDPSWALAQTPRSYMGTRGISELTTAISFSTLSIEPPQAVRRSNFDRPSHFTPGLI